MNKESCFHPAPRAYYFAREGWPFIATGLGFGVLAALLGWSIVAGVGAGFAAFSLYFFRNPERVSVADTQSVISPADGRVVQIAEAVEPDFLNRPMRRVSIFMSPLNVHVNRVPITGIVKGVRYHPGKFLMASVDKASTENERNVTYVESGGGQPVVFAQIAGWLARRIVCYLRPGDGVVRGERCGLIRYGSRVDIFLPLETQLDVVPQQMVQAGETVIGRLP